MINIPLTLFGVTMGKQNIIYTLCFWLSDRMKNEREILTIYLC